jgi:hypothetical protein
MIMKTEYKCICDGCYNDIPVANDENDVKLNSAKYVYCPICFSDLCSLIELHNLVRMQEKIDHE